MISHRFWQPAGQVVPRSIPSRPGRRASSKPVLFKVPPRTEQAFSCGGCWARELGQDSRAHSLIAGVPVPCGRCEPQPLCPLRLPRAFLRALLQMNNPPMRRSRKGQRSRDPTRSTRHFHSLPTDVSRMMRPEISTACMPPTFPVGDITCDTKMVLGRTARISPGLIAGHALGLGAGSRSARPSGLSTRWGSTATTAMR